MSAPLKRPRRPGEPNIVTSERIAVSIDREEASRAQEPVRASSRTSPRRCNHCREWRTPKNGRCGVCRQKFEPVPLVGLKAVS